MNQYAHERRFPFGALRLAAGDLSLSELSRRCGVQRRQLLRYATAGVPERVADRIAISAGLHPGEVWPEWFEEAS